MQPGWRQVNLWQVLSRLTCTMLSMLTCSRLNHVVLTRVSGMLTCCPGLSLLCMLRLIFCMGGHRLSPAPAQCGGRDGRGAGR